MVAALRPDAVVDLTCFTPELALPDRRDETIHHVHADDVAGLHQACLEQPDAAAGQSFNSVCTQAFTLHGYAEVVGRHFGHEPRLEFVPWDEFASRVDAEHADTTLEHIGRAPVYSMDKARTVLGFRPKHDVTDTVLESIDAWVAAPGTDATIPQPTPAHRHERSIRVLRIGCHCGRCGSHGLA